MIKNQACELCIENRSKQFGECGRCSTCLCNKCSCKIIHECQKYDCPFCLLDVFDHVIQTTDLERYKLN